MHAETTPDEGLAVYAMGPGGACDGGPCLSLNDRWWEGDDDEEFERYLVFEGAIEACAEMGGQCSRDNLTYDMAVELLYGNATRFEFGDADTPVDRAFVIVATRKNKSAAAGKVVVDPKTTPVFDTLVWPTSIIGNGPPVSA